MKLKLTPFGKVVRKLRIDRAMTMKDMADRLETSPVFLSAVETGRKNLTKNLVEKVISVLNVNAMELEALEDAISKTRKKVELHLEKEGVKKRELAAVFARNFPELPDTSVEKLLTILRKAEKSERH